MAAGCYLELASTPTDSEGDRQKVKLTLHKLFFAITIINSYSYDNYMIIVIKSLIALLQSPKIRKVSLDSDFYTGYRRNIIAAEEVLVSITIPCTQENEHFVAFKQVINHLLHRRLNYHFRNEVVDKYHIPCLFK